MLYCSLLLLVCVFAGAVSTLAGSTVGAAGNVDSTGTGARFSGPTSVFLSRQITPSAPASRLFVADTGNNAIRVVNVDTAATTTFALLPCVPVSVTAIISESDYSTTGATCGCTYTILCSLRVYAIDN